MPTTCFLSPCTWRSPAAPVSRSSCTASTSAPAFRSANLPARRACLSSATGNREAASGGDQKERGDRGRLPPSPRSLVADRKSLIRQHRSKPHFVLLHLFNRLIGLGHREGLNLGLHSMARRHVQHLSYPVRAACRIAA